MTKTQYLIVLLINVVMFTTLFGHIYNEPVKTVYQPKIVEHDIYKAGKQIVKVPEIKTVTKTQTVTKQVCDQGQQVVQEMQTAGQTCKAQSNLSNNYALGDFSIDTNDKPKFNCVKD